MEFLGSIKRYLFVAALLCISSGSQSDEKPLGLYEQKIKAGLVYNLIKYTAWPKTSVHQTLTICLLGGDPFDGYLSPLNGRMAQQATISINQINKITEAGHCHLLVIHKSQSNKLPELIEFLQTKNILTVSDMEKFSIQGGMVELATENSKITLYINNGNVTHNGLTIDERMLKLAKLVSNKEGA
jgi:hypothetical protein